MRPPSLSQAHQWWMQDMLRARVRIERLQLRVKLPLAPPALQLRTRLPHQLEAWESVPREELQSSVIHLQRQG